MRCLAADQKGNDADLRKELDSIEAYAKVMGMPRLEVETTYVDADFRRKLGDLTMAMKAITRATSAGCWVWRKATMAAPPGIAAQPPGPQGEGMTTHSKRSPITSA